MIIAQSFFCMLVGLFLGFCLGLWKKNSYQSKHLKKYFPINRFERFADGSPYEYFRPLNKPRKIKGEED